MLVLSVTLSDVISSGADSALGGGSDAASAVTHSDDRVDTQLSGLRGVALDQV